MSVDVFGRWRLLPGFADFGNSASWLPPVCPPSSGLGALSYGVSQSVSVGRTASTDSQPEADGNTRSWATSRRVGLLPRLFMGKADGVCILASLLYTLFYTLFSLGTRRAGQLTLLFGGKGPR